MVWSVLTEESQKMVPFSDYTVGSDFLFVKPMDNFDKKKEEDFPVQILTQSLMTFHDI